ncbi:hypothetical protein WJX72_008259 [[Myrmecia] bisecta]|uniref:Uncharacterized protein n=1 Tax=[Myrmecia] bisecta TaxID=41462 RepID=A0AAW1PPI7_9CHLO
MEVQHLWRSSTRVTDDSELALALAHGLQGHKPQLGFPADAVAARYCDWLDSKPFDMGTTCASAFSVTRGTLGSSGNNDKHAPDPGLATTMRARAAGSQASKANGALMRCTPLAVWGSRLSTDELVAAAVADATLSHPN